MSPMTNHFDVLIVGAGISGIGAAYHLQEKCPDKSFIIFEARENFGGTWDLFQYPGIRSDSDMHTMGFRFKPWKSHKSIADGPSIMEYLKETIEENGLQDKIHFKSKVKSAFWSSQSAQWEIEVEDNMTGKIEQYTCSFLHLCGGYYNYSEGYIPIFKGSKSFKGEIIHPQKWTKDIDYQDKDVVVIGSGATAVTMIPAMANKVKHITMLQRSPTYYMSRPDIDYISNFLKKYLPEALAYFLVRWKNILLGRLFFVLLKRNPQKYKEMLIQGVKDNLGEDLFDEKDFTPKYMPWDQRLCFVPNADLFESMKSGKASVVTDSIDKFTQDGILLKSGKELTADIIVTATGLNMELLNGIKITIDNAPLDISSKMSFKGRMFSDVPNLTATFGYTTASWTLGADLTNEFLCRLIKYMDKKGFNKVVPTPCKNIKPEGDYLDLNSGYIERVKHTLPKQGNKSPWINSQNYLQDIREVRLGSIKNKDLKFVASQ